MIWKRFAVSFLASLLGLALYCGIVWAAWQLMFPILITDTSITTRAYYPVVLGFGGQTLVDAGKIAANGTDTNMQIATSDIEYMMSTTNVTAVIPNLPSGGTVATSFYTGYSPAQTGFPIITGSGGYVTVSDNASLELGGNFTVEYNGYVDTSAGDGKNIVYKQNAFAIYVNGVTDWTTPTGFIDPDVVWTNEPLAYDDDTVTLAFQQPVGAGAWSSFLELTHAALSIDSLRYYAGGTSALVNEIDVDVYDGAAWHDVYQGAFVQNVWEEKDVYVACTITKSRVRLKNNDVGNENVWLYEFDFGADTVNGGQIRAVIEDLIALEVVGVTNDEHNVEAEADGVNFTLSVDAGVSTVFFAGVVPNNANNWTYSENNSASYTDNITVLVGGVHQLWLEPDVMLVGTNIPDRSGNSHNGTITWGSNSNVSITYGEMTSYESYAATANATGGFDVPTSVMPRTWFAAGENVTALPFYDSFSSVSAQTGQPAQMLYALAIIGVAFGTFIGLAVFTRSALMAYVAMMVVLMIGSSMTIIPWWIVFASLVTGGGILYLYKQVAY